MSAKTTIRSKRIRKSQAAKKARRLGYRKTVHGWGGGVTGIVADKDAS